MLCPHERLEDGSSRAAEIAGRVRVEVHPVTTTWPISPEGISMQHRSSSAPWGVIVVALTASLSTPACAKKDEAIRKEISNLR